MYGAYLLAVYNEEEEQFQTISKIGTGFSEVLLAQLSESLKPAIIPGPKSYYRCCSGKCQRTSRPAPCAPVLYACLTPCHGTTQDEFVNVSQPSAPCEQRSLLAVKTECTAANAPCAVHVR